MKRRMKTLLHRGGHRNRHDTVTTKGQSPNDESPFGSRERSRHLVTASDLNANENLVDQQIPERSPTCTGSHMRDSDLLIQRQPERLPSRVIRTSESEGHILQPQQGSGLGSPRFHNPNVTCVSQGGLRATGLYEEDHPWHGDRSKASSTSSYHTPPDSPSEANIGFKSSRLEDSDIHACSSQRKVSSSETNYDRTNGLLDIRKSEDTHVHSLANGLERVLNLSDTVDADQVTSYAPAATHTTVRPYVREIKEEQIYREIHNHDVFHRIQPVYELEVLPTRHFVPGPDSSLIEVSGDNLPNCTSTSQRWFVAEKPAESAQPSSKEPPKTSTARDAVAKYITPEGFERIETTIVHTPTLEDTSALGIPAIRVEFDEHGVVQESPAEKTIGIQENKFTTPSLSAVTDKKERL
ncbi:hypothetical protein F4779DRAFT_638102 [Xylariaceae sp. FL0662B]|nr:hypothetical protein F4779DRAFT_638102 [Xylariaceae sp. FL0662B]